MSFVVLASSSAGNCSALVRGSGRNARVTLIDAGLSPTRTRSLLHAATGLGIDRVDDVLFTHLDADHAHPGWIRALPAHAWFRVHRAHVRRAERSGLARRRTRVFDDEPFDLPAGVRVTPVSLAHDELGVAAFRFDPHHDTPTPDGTLQHPPASLGYATDLGRATDGLINTLAGVDVLAIESNYCPALQRASERPEFLKRRIMDGAGHLSNQQAADAARDIGPRRHAVLLHLSRQCNTPERALALHAGRPYATTAARHDRAIDPITLAQPAAPP